MESGEVTQWIKHLGQIQGLEFVSLESMSKPKLVEIGSRVSFLATLVRVGESVRSDSTRGPALINNVENNFRCPETCTMCNCTHMGIHVHVSPHHTHTYKNVR